MSLEDPNTIDHIIAPEPGKLHLVIDDLGLTTDDVLRLDKLRAKLKTYVTHIASEVFAKEHPGVRPSDVAIVVKSRRPVSDAMRLVTHVTAPEDSDIRIPVEFVMHEPAGAAAEGRRRSEQPAPGRGWLRTAAILLLIGGPLFILGGLNEIQKASRLERDGVTVPGTIVEHDVLPVASGRNAHKIIAQYSPEGAPAEKFYLREFTIPQATYDRAVREGSIPIKYMPGNPRIAAVTDLIKANKGPLAIGFLLTILGIVALGLRKMASASI